MFEQSYESSAGNSSAGDKPAFRKGSRDAYAKDMYDSMPSMRPNGPANATGKPNTGIQGSEGKSSSLDGPSSGKGNTGDRSVAARVKANDGSKDYGKGNPYKGNSKSKDGQLAGSKPVKSISELRKIAQGMGS